MAAHFGAGVNLAALWADPTLRYIISGFVGAVVTAPWIYNGAPIPFHGPLLGGPAVSTPMVPRLMAPNHPVTRIFGVPNTYCLSAPKLLPPSAQGPTSTLAIVEHLTDEIPFQTTLPTSSFSPAIIFAIILALIMILSVWSFISLLKHCYHASVPDTGNIYHIRHADNKIHIYRRDYQPPDLWPTNSDVSVWNPYLQVTIVMQYIQGLHLVWAYNEMSNHAILMGIEYNVSRSIIHDSWRLSNEALEQEHEAQLARYVPKERHADLRDKYLDLRDSKDELDEEWRQRFKRETEHDGNEIRNLSAQLEVANKRCRIYKDKAERFMALYLDLKESRTSNRDMSTPAHPIANLPVPAPSTTSRQKLSLSGPQAAISIAPVNAIPSLPKLEISSPKDGINVTPIEAVSTVKQVLSLSGLRGVNTVVPINVRPIAHIYLESSTQTLEPVGRVYAIQRTSGTQTDPMVITPIEAPRGPIDLASMSEEEVLVEVLPRKIKPATGAKRATQPPPWTVPAIPVLDMQDTDMEVDEEAVEDFIRSMEQTSAEPYYPLDQFPVDHFPVDQGHQYSNVNMQDTVGQQNDQPGFMHVEQSGFGQGFQQDETMEDVMPTDDFPVFKPISQEELRWMNRTQPWTLADNTASFWMPADEVWPEQIQPDQPSTMDYSVDGQANQPQPTGDLWNQSHGSHGFLMPQTNSGSGDVEQNQPGTVDSSGDKQGFSAPVSSKGKGRAAEFQHLPTRSEYSGVGQDGPSNPPQVVSTPPVTAADSAPGNTILAPASGLGMVNYENYPSTWQQVKTPGLAPGSLPAYHPMFGINPNADSTREYPLHTFGLLSPSINRTSSPGTTTTPPPKPKPAYSPSYTRMPRPSSNPTPIPHVTANPKLGFISQLIAGARYTPAPTGPVTFPTYSGGPVTFKTPITASAPGQAPVTAPVQTPPTVDPAFDPALEGLVLDPAAERVTFDTPTKFQPDPAPEKSALEEPARKKVSKDIDVDFATSLKAVDETEDQWTKAFTEDQWAKALQAFAEEDVPDDDDDADADEHGEASGSKRQAAEDQSVDTTLRGNYPPKTYPGDDSVETPRRYTKSDRKIAPLRRRRPDLLAAQGLLNLSAAPTTIGAANQSGASTSSQ
jgi:hypothetical protein